VQQNTTPTANTTADKKQPVDVKVSILIVNYNGLKDILRCIPSLLAQDYDDYEIVIVDNASNDGSADQITEQYPDIKLIRAEKNLGFGGGNNLAAKHAQGQYLAFLNPDTTVEPDWLPKMVHTLESHPEAGVATAKILVMDEPHPINTTGNYMHITGLGYLRGWQEPADRYNDAGEIFAMSGAAFMMPRPLFEEIGGFDEIFYPAYVEDIDLSWRVWMAGYRVRYVPDAVVYHDYTLTFNIGKYTMLERHRQMMVFKNFRWATILVLLPALILGEIVTWGYAVLSGPKHLLAKLHSYGWFFNQWGTVMAARKRTQATRKISDRMILQMCVHKLAYGQAGDGLAVKIGQWVLDPLFFLMHRIALLIVRW